jgi:hypothetical protein
MTVRLLVCRLLENDGVVLRMLSDEIGTTSPVFLRLRKSAVPILIGFDFQQFLRHVMPLV